MTVEHVHSTPERSRLAWHDIYARPADAATKVESLRRLRAQNETRAAGKNSSVVEPCRSSNVLTEPHTSSTPPAPAHAQLCRVVQHQDDASTTVLTSRYVHLHCVLKFTDLHSLALLLPPTPEFAVAPSYSRRSVSTTLYSCCRSWRQCASDSTCV